jgi:uncharacterized membrane protein
MAFIGRLHPLLIHFPIALVIAAAVAEAAALITGSARWRSVAIGNVRFGALLALAAAVAGWRLALLQGPDASALLEWHRWVGTVAAGVTFAAAFATAGADSRSALRTWTYRTAVFAAAALVGLTGHLGGMLVWGANFLRP